MEKYFFHADEDRFHWQTQNVFVARREKELLEGIFKQRRNAAILEVGCGEGANLFFLKDSFQKITGLDFSLEKSKFAKENSGVTAIVQANALFLPFRADFFDIVFCRDILHHVNGKRKIISEMFRVCKNGGRIYIVEANGLNIIGFFQSLLIKVERGMIFNSAKELMKDIKKLLIWHVKITHKHSLPLFRIFMHYRYGKPKLSQAEVFIFCLNLFEKICDFVIPQYFWYYTIIEIEKTKMN
ncbi:MAG: class I SAM-dependent methyltransferase [Candidatus Omnitrophica bacterium]|nr:class I SAM-dependent methyltransferase [Candidatus Omnitrophota bacterium]